MSDFDVCQEDWIHNCEQHVRAGELLQLEKALAAAPLADDTPVKLFCLARLGVARADYEQASRLFQQVVTASRTAPTTMLHQQSLVWLAYCHYFLGNYSLTCLLVERAARLAASDDPIYAWVFFIRGILAANTGTMAEAQEYLEQARDLALQLQDTWCEARCCANLAVVCLLQGLMDRSGRMIQRVQWINSEGVPNPQQLLQVRNIEVYRLRLMGNVEQALQVALPLPDESDDGSLHYRGWLALAASSVATDMGNFALAEQAWQRAADLIAQVHDGNAAAELPSERAWLRFRQNRLDEAYGDIHQALNQIEPQVYDEHFHALVIAAVIDMARDDLAFVSRNLHEVISHFRATRHNVGLASVLFHAAAYHFQGQRLDTARRTLAEAFTLLHEYRLHGAFYWHPPTMVTLCKLAIEEDWGDHPEQIFSHPLLRDNPALAENFEPEIHPGDLLGDFAAALVAHRLAAEYWQQFAALLNDPRPRIRRRAAQILRASKDKQALEKLETLRHDSDPGLRDWYHQHIAPQRGPTLQIFTLDRFEILIQGQPLRLHNAGTRKARALLGALLLAGKRGITSNDLAVLLWPNQPESARRASLHTTVAALRGTLRAALAGERVITFDPETRRYALDLQANEVWWDWEYLRQLALSVRHSEKPTSLSQAEVPNYQGFMEEFWDLLPQPQDADQDTHMLWNTVYDMLVEQAEMNEGLAATWIEQIGQAQSRRTEAET